MNKTQINKDLELLRKMWGLERLQTPFIARHELDKFWEKRKEIEELETKLKELKNGKEI